MIEEYNRTMKKFWVPFLVVVGVGMVGLLSARFLFGGDEDSWICSNGDWVKHGNPRDPMPQVGCGEVVDELKAQTMEEIGISFKYSKDMTFRKEIADDGTRIRVASFYLEKEGYTLYVVYEASNEVGETKLEQMKIGMDQATIKEANVGGLAGIEGLATGPKTKYLTAVIKNNRLLTFSTFPPTPENKEITEKILDSIRFE